MLLVLIAIMVRFVARALTNLFRDTESSFAKNTTPIR
jgi:hypothetical protein